MVSAKRVFLQKKIADFFASSGRSFAAGFVRKFRSELPDWVATDWAMPQVEPDYW